MATQFAVDFEAKTWLRFERLTREWKTERGTSSSITKLATLPAYQKIIGMGPAVVPMILKQLAAEGDEPDQWFWALRVITEANPVPDEDAGDFVRMSRAWIAWGKEESDAWYLATA